MVAGSGNIGCCSERQPLVGGRGRTRRALDLAAIRFFETPRPCRRQASERCRSPSSQIRSACVAFRRCETPMITACGDNVMNRCALALASVLIVAAVVWQRANEPTSNDTAKAAVQEPVASYKQWRLACAKLAANRELKGKLPDKKLLPLPRFTDFERGLDAYMQLEREGPLADAKAWVGAQPDPKVFFDFENTWYGGKKVAFQPFAAKLVLPKDATVILMGDLHGDVRSLLSTLDELNDRKILDGFKFRDSKHYLLFLGDFTDRGAYGTEVLYTLRSEEHTSELK